MTSIKFLKYAWQHDMPVQFQQIIRSIVQCAIWDHCGTKTAQPAKFPVRQDKNITN